MKLHTYQYPDMKLHTYQYPERIMMVWSTFISGSFSRPLSWDRQSYKKVANFGKMCLHRKNFAYHGPTSWCNSVKKNGDTSSFGSIQDWIFRQGTFGIDLLCGDNTGSALVERKLKFAALGEQWGPGAQHHLRLSSTSNEHQVWLDWHIMDSCHRGQL